MKIVQVKPNTLIKAIQLTSSNIKNVYSTILPMFEEVNVVSWNVTYPTIESIYKGEAPSLYTRGMNGHDCGIKIILKSGSCYRIRLYDWLVISYDEQGKGHIDIYSYEEFEGVFTVTEAPQENTAFNMSLVNDSNLQRIFSNPNDYRLFRHIIDVYMKQVSEMASKNVIPLKTNEVIALCRMSDKTFRKSRNSLIDMGVIYESLHGYKISFEVLNNIISKSTQQ